MARCGWKRGDPGRKSGVRAWRGEPGRGEPSPVESRAGADAARWSQEPAVVQALALRARVLYGLWREDDAGDSRGDRAERVEQCERRDCARGGGAQRGGGTREGGRGVAAGALKPTRRRPVTRLGPRDASRLLSAAGRAESSAQLGGPVVIDHQALIVDAGEEQQVGAVRRDVIVRVRGRGWEEHIVEELGA